MTTYIVNAIHPSSSKPFLLCRSTSLESVKFNISSWLESFYYSDGTKISSEEIIYDKIQAICYHPNIPLNKVKFHIEEKSCQ